MNSIQWGLIIFPVKYFWLAQPFANKVSRFCVIYHLTIEVSAKLAGWVIIVVKGSSTLTKSEHEINIGSHSVFNNFLGTFSEENRRHQRTYHLNLFCVLLAESSPYDRQQQLCPWQETWSSFSNVLIVTSDAKNITISTCFQIPKNFVSKILEIVTALLFERVFK